MKPNRVHVHQDPAVLDEVPRQDIEALETARARQDVSHQKLDEFIAAALAELSDDIRAA